MKKFALLILLAACSKTGNDIKAEPVTQKLPAEAATVTEDVTRGWYVEKRITVEGNYVTRINDHETGAVCYVVSRFDPGTGTGYSSASMSAAIHCLPDKDLKH